MRAKDFIINEAEKPKRRTGPGHAWGRDLDDLGQKTGARGKRFVDQNEYGEARRKAFQRWAEENNLRKVIRNVLFDLKGKEQHTTIYHPPGKRDDIWAYELPSGSGAASFAPMRMVRKDIAPHGLLY